MQWQSLLHTKPPAQSMTLDTKSQLRFVFIALLHFASTGWKTEENVQVQSSAVLLREKISFIDSVLEMMELMQHDVCPRP